VQVSYPFKVNHAGRTSSTENDDKHIRDLIEQILFTVPGERVNLPDFGIGLLQFVFGANSDETFIALQFLVQGELQKWLGDLIELQTVQITTEDSELNVVVSYRIIRTQQTVHTQFRS